MPNYKVTIAENGEVREMERVGVKFFRIGRIWAPMKRSVGCGRRTASIPRAKSQREDPERGLGQWVHCGSEPLRKVVLGDPML